uniref:DUF6932 family protein n=1 Tax=Synechocystis sp. PCC 7509 TaxID=927677 RepID=UPI0003145371
MLEWQWCGYEQANIYCSYFDRKREAQKAEYGGEFFPAESEADGDETHFLEFFQNDKDRNRKGIIAIDLLKWQP